MGSSLIAQSFCLLVGEPGCSIYLFYSETDMVNSGVPRLLIISTRSGQREDSDPRLSNTMDVFHKGDCDEGVRAGHTPRLVFTCNSFQRFLVGLQNEFKESIRIEFKNLF